MASEFKQWISVFKRYKINIAVSCIITTLLTPITATAMEQDLLISSSQSYNHPKQDSPYIDPLNKPDDNVYSGQFEYGLHVANFHALANLNYLSNDAEQKTHLDGVELYYENQFSEDSPWEYSLGRKLFNWGVGYAYNPLDVVQNNSFFPRLKPTLPINQGKDHASLVYIGQSHSWQLVMYHPEQDDFQTLHFEKSDTAAVLYFNTFISSLELHIIAQAEKNSDPLIGTGFSWVVSDQAEIHASAVAFKDGRDFSFASSPTIPIPLNRIVVQQESAYKALVGINYTLGFDNPINIIAEVWHDGNAPDDEFWEDYLTFIHREDVNSVPPESGELLLIKNLHQRNALLRLSQNLENWNWETSLLKPMAENSGSIYSLFFGWQVADNWKLTLNGRIKTGKEKQLFTSLPSDYDITTSITWEL